MTKDLSPEYFTCLLGTEIVSVEAMTRGGNSRAIKVTAANGARYAAKVYPGPTADGLDRREVEFNALQFLGNRGFDSVPAPLVSDAAGHCAVFEYIEGNPIASHEVTNEDIIQVSRFLIQIGEIGRDSESTALPNAAEACFSAQAIVENLTSRLERLRAVREDTALTGFLEGEFLPSFHRAAEMSNTKTVELALEHRTLSPSDFGFHNALRRPDGRLAFLDFEYFGWDDPAKMVSDFLLHPAMELTPEMKNRFVENMAGSLKRDPAFAERLETVFPLFGLKWCLILLNAFLPQYRLQRGLSDAELAGIFGNQLEKARLMLSTVESGYARFPYRDEENTVNVN